LFRTTTLVHLMMLWISVFLVSSVQAYPTYHESYFQQKLDHFDPTSQELWPHRFLHNNDSWDGRGTLPNGCRGPILLYTGNEGPIDAFWPSNGFMIDVLAPKLGGLLLFPEERFYGKSMPLPWSAENLKYLTTAQVLEDYVEVINHVKSTLPGASNCPVVAFGGSYGATLTALLRASHPTAVVGGMAASSELGYYDKERWAEHGVTEFTFDDIVTGDYGTALTECLPAIQKVKAVIEATDEETLVQTFHLCDVTALGANKTDLFTYALEEFPQIDYPYAIGSTPAKPVTYVCEMLVAAALEDSNTLLKAAADVIDLALGFDGSCVPFMYGPGNTPGDGPALASWGWQSCTETLHAFSARGIREYTFDYSSSKDLCARIFNNIPLPDMSSIARAFGGYALADGSAGVSHLIWSQGTLDPWHGWFQNVATPPSGSEVYHFLMEGSAHHLDLRGPNPKDPPAVTAARIQQEAIITKWIQEAGAPTEVVV